MFGVTSLCTLDKLCLKVGCSQMLGKLAKFHSVFSVSSSNHRVLVLFVSGDVCAVLYSCVFELSVMMQNEFGTFQMPL